MDEVIHPVHKLSSKENLQNEIGQNSLDICTSITRSKFVKKQQ
jgi:hypothetical protein